VWVDAGLAGRTPGGQGPRALVDSLRGLPAWSRRSLGASAGGAGIYRQPKGTPLVQADPAWMRPPHAPSRALQNFRLLMVMAQSDRRGPTSPRSSVNIRLAWLMRATCAERHFIS
jgi:hypothetical protein